MGNGNTKDSDASLKEFLAEAEEIVESLNSDLMRLSSGGKTDPSLLNNIFRASHTLKGLSGMFGFTAMATLSHKLEDLLDSLRLGKIELTPIIVDTLFEAISVLHSLLESKSRGEPELSVSGIIDQLNSAVLHPGTDKEADAATTGIDPAIMSVLTEYEEHRLNTSIKEGLNIIKVYASFPIVSFDTDLADLTAVLKDKGEIITTLPSTGSSPGDAISFDIVVATQATREEVEKGIDNQAIEVTLASKTSQSSTPIPKETGKEQPPRQTAAQPEVEAVSSVESKGEEGLKSITQTVRVDIGKLDSLMNIVGELVLLKSSLIGIAANLRSREGTQDISGEFSKTVKSLEKRLAELQEGVLESRMVPLSQVFEKLARTIRKIGRETGKDVDFVVKGGETELDKIIVEELANPLMHIVRNSLDHGIEPADERIRGGKPEKGTIRISASQKGNHVVVEVLDDGKGIDHERILQKAIEKGLAEPGAVLKKEEIINFMFLPGFSTKDTVSEISGRGVGMDVVKKNISDLSGMVEIDTEKGKGTTIILTLPMTLAIIKALIVEVSGYTYAIPLNSVLENFVLKPSEIETIETREFVRLRDTTLPLVRIKDLFHLSGNGEEGRFAVVVGLAEKRLGLVVDKLKGQQDIVMKSIGNRFGSAKGIAGATDLGEKTILVLDIGSIMEECLKGQGGRRIARIAGEVQG